VPYALPAVGQVLTRLNFAEPIVSLVNGLESAVESLKTRVTNVENSNSTKYTKPGGGIPSADLAAAVQALLAAAGAANVRWLEWKGDPALTRPTTSTAVTYIWVKRDPALADPPIDATHILQGVDILLRAA
jgi:hypothetical protein